MAKTDNDDLEQAHKMIAEQDEFLRKISEASLIYATVVDRDGEDFLTLSSTSKTVRVHKSTELSVAVGDEVVVHPETYQIIGLSGRQHSGPIALLKTDLGAGRWEIEATGTSRTVRASESLIVAPRAGDEVILDPTSMVFTEVMPRKEAEFIATSPNVKWDDIGGQDKAKQELQEAIALLRGGNALFDAYGAKAPKGLLFQGPPGCGKTMLGKAAATELAGDAPGAFIYIKAPELLTMWVGQSEAKIRGIFQMARNYKEAHGQAPILFIDEADAILQKRGSGISSDVEKTIVPAFLTEMDGLEASSALVILATNRADTLDPAVIRDGRIDRRIFIDRPDEENAERIFEISLKGLPIGEGFTAEQLGKAGTETIFQPTGPLMQNVSGAMIVGIVDRAKRRAIRRDLTNGGKASGICLQDITASALEAGMELAA